MAPAVGTTLTHCVCLCQLGVSGQSDTVRSDQVAVPYIPTIAHCAPWEVIGGRYMRCVPLSRLFDPNATRRPLGSDNTNITRREAKKQVETV